MRVKLASSSEILGNMTYSEGHTVVCNLEYCTSEFLEYDDRFVDSTCVLHCSIVSVRRQNRIKATSYFQAKSRERQMIGSASPCNQNTGLGNKRGITPSYSVEKCNFGATVAYTERKTIQMNMLPGIART